MAEQKLNLVGLSKLFTDEDKAREFIESKLWPGGPVCPHCASATYYKLTAKPDSKRPVRAGVYKCKDCRKQYTVRIGTIFEDSHIPFSKWLMALHLMTSSKKGVSALQISREVGVTIKSAWFLCHRIREAMRTENPAPLTGEVQVDETYVGGKPRPAYRRKKDTHGLSKKDAPHAKPANANYGRGTKKAPVAVLVERDARSLCQHVERTNGAVLKELIRVNVTPDSTIVTDDYSAYRGIGKEFEGGHQVVKHSHNEYVNIEGHHTNTAESFFALLKRGHYGVFHSMSKQHLHRYCDEFEFRWNHRKVTDGERMIAAIQGAEGKRLKYA
ncbi:MAG: IS1595 family transposase [Gemmataceae bacterium]